MQCAICDRKAQMQTAVTNFHSKCSVRTRCDYILDGVSGRAFEQLISVGFSALPLALVLASIGNGNGSGPLSPAHTIKARCAAPKVRVVTDGQSSDSAAERRAHARSYKNK